MKYRIVYRWIIAYFRHTAWLSMAGRVKYHVDTAPTLVIHSSFDRASQGALPPQPQCAGSKAPTVCALHWGCTSRAGEVPWCPGAQIAQIPGLQSPFDRIEELYSLLRLWGGSKSRPCWTRQAINVNARDGTWRRVEESSCTLLRLGIWFAPSWSTETFSDARFFFFEGKTERLCYVAMLQKQVPKFLKMSTPMNLAARRRAAICNLGKELKVNGFPWSGRLGADNQFVLFVQVYDNEGHKANAVQRQETPSTRSITSGSKPVEAIGHYESHMEPPPNLQTEATCQWFGYTWLVSDKFEAWTPLPPCSVLQGWTLSIVAGMSSRKSRLSGLQILIHFARLVFWKKISWFCRCDDGCHFVVEYVWWSSPYWSLVVFLE